MDGPVYVHTVTGEIITIPPEQWASMLRALDVAINQTCVVWASDDWCNVRRVQQKLTQVR